MNYCGIADVALVTNDIEKTVQFYRDVLGMPVAVIYAGEINGQRIRHYFFKRVIGRSETVADLPGVRLSGFLAW